MNYQSKNPEVRKLLDRPRWQEWVEFEIEHIIKQAEKTPIGWPDDWAARCCAFFPVHGWEDDVKSGGHEVERLLHHLSLMLNVKYHRYLHRGLTSSNVVDSCNHRRWNRLSAELVQTLHAFDRVVEPVMCRSDQEIPGMTHGRRAHRTCLAYRFSSVKHRYGAPDLQDVDGGPTGGYKHRQATPRQGYWPTWVWLMQIVMQMEQIATDYRFYCSDLSEAVGVTGIMAPGVATTSSAMPGKVNPTVFERVCSVGYIVRTMCTAQMLQPPKWLDADLVHSALERETIDRIWDHTFWLVEEMTRLVKSTTLTVIRQPVPESSFDRLQDRQEQGFEYSKAREDAAKFPTG